MLVTSGIGKAAYRLASNSLLEAAVSGGFVAQDIAARRRKPWLPDEGAGDDPTSVRPILSRAASVLRDGDALRAAACAL